MARKIYWQDPDSTLVTQVEVSKSETLYGSYTVSTTMDATSDGSAKTTSNTWVTNYTDTAGARTDWYKIRFYDGTNLVWSDYSEPVTSEELVKLCSVDDVKNVIDTTGRWTDDEIFTVISEVDDLIYIECGTPIQAMYTESGKSDNTQQDTYFVGEENIHRVDRVFYGTTTMTEYFLDDGYKVNKKYGMVRMLSVASGGPTLDTQNEIEVHYVPNVFHKLSLYNTIVKLLEEHDMTSDGKASKELQVARRKLDMVERVLAHRIGLQISSDVRFYDGLYGVNRKHVRQNHDRNKYIGNYGW